MIECKLGEIVIARQAIEKLATKEMPIRTLINLNKLIEKFVKELQLVEKEKHQMLAKYGEPSNDDKNIFKIKEEHIEQFQKEINELMEVGVIMSEIEKIKKEDVLEVKLNYEEYLQLKPFLD